MGRISLIVAAAVLLLLAAGAAFMGFFPPEPQTRTIERPVPLERVAPGGAPAMTPGGAPAMTPGGAPAPAATPPAR